MGCVFLILPILPFLGWLVVGGAIGAGIASVLTTKEIEEEASNHTKGYDLSSTYSEIKRISREKGNGYFNADLEQHMVSDNRCIDSWSMQAKSIGSMYEGKRIYYDS